MRAFYARFSSVKIFNVNSKRITDKKPDVFITEQKTAEYAPICGRITEEDEPVSSSRVSSASGTQTKPVPSPNEFLESSASGVPHSQHKNQGTNPSQPCQSKSTVPSVNERSCPAEERRVTVSPTPSYREETPLVVWYLSVAVGQARHLVMACSGKNDGTSRTTLTPDVPAVFNSYAVVRVGSRENVFTTKTVWCCREPDFDFKVVSPSYFLPVFFRG